eukprot:c6935_g1_i1.p2 GENE.c6935_g1_i1~~c6935_g1_i1.p2  ORF type:complete len:287 (+),score=48.42 c6935_g1_i1:30-863(+)
MTFQQRGIAFLGGFMPLATESAFHERGVLTPAEFVAAGDFLCFKCPTWAWSSGVTRESFLPDDKQFLCTKAVPCEQRIAAYDMMFSGSIMEIDAAGMGDFEVIAEGGDGGDCEAVAMDISDGDAGSDSDGSGPVPDLDDFDEPNLLEASDPAAGSMRDNVLKTRTYDLYITYDRYYQTPRMWLCGYDEDQTPLSKKQIYQDISAVHAKKTVTLEHNPHLGMQMLSIHPCKHADVMKSWMARMAEGGVDVRPEQSLFLFLKLISSIVPTVNYDFTFDF